MKTRQPIACPLVATLVALTMLVPACSPDATVRGAEAQRAAMQTIHLMQHPLALAIDPTTRRVLVLDAATSLPPEPSGVIPYQVSSVSILNLTTGAVLHTVPVTTTAISEQRALALDPRRGRVYVPIRGLNALAAGTLLGFDDRTGSLRARLPLGVGPVHVAIAPTRRRIFVTDAGGFNPSTVQRVAYGDVRVFNADTGALIRVVGPGGLVGPAFYGGHLVTDDKHGRVWVVNERRTQPNLGIVTLDASTGAPTAATYFPDSSYAVIGSLAVDDMRNRVLTGGADSLSLIGQVHLFDATSQHPLATTLLQQGNAIDVTVATDTITGQTFVAAAGAGSTPGPLLVSVLQTATGNVVHTSSVDIPTLRDCLESVDGVIVDSRRGHVFVALDSAGCKRGYLVVLDAHTGAVRQEIPAGMGGPYSIALDASSGRLFLANFADKTVTLINA